MTFLWVCLALQNLHHVIWKVQPFSGFLQCTSSLKDVSSTFFFASITAIPFPSKNSSHVINVKSGLYIKKFDTIAGNQCWFLSSHLAFKLWLNWWNILWGQELIFAEDVNAGKSLCLQFDSHWLQLINTCVVIYTK